MIVPFKKWEGRSSLSFLYRGGMGFLDHRIQQCQKCGRGRAVSDTGMPAVIEATTRDQDFEEASATTFFCVLTKNRPKSWSHHDSHDRAKEASQQ